MFTKHSIRNLTTTAKRFRSYGGRHTAVLIPGDGIGPEMALHLRNTFAMIKAPIDFETIDLKKDTWSPEMLNYAVTAIKRNGGCIKGNINTSIDESTGDIVAKNQKMRTELDVFANVIHAKSYKGTEKRHKDIDLYLIRENTEGEYAGLEHETVPGVVESLKIMTEAKCENIAEFAFKFAESHNRKKVTAVHKANIMKKGDGLFRQVAHDVSQKYPHIEFSDMIVDNTCMQLVSNPWQFDVMLMPNLYGNIVANVCCGLVGGAGLCAGQNYSTHNINFAPNSVGIFEMATRNTGESIMGKDVANPTAFLMAGVKLLEFYKCYHHANLIRPALAKTLDDDLIHTADLGGSYGTADFMDAFRDNLNDIMVSGVRTVDRNIEKLTQQKTDSIPSI